MISRRYLFGMAWGVGYGVRHLEAAKSEVWNAKPAAEWTDADIERILTKSPWVKETAVSFTPGSPGGGAGGGGGGRGGGGGGRGGGGKGGGGGMGGGGAAPQFKAIVRWESARPILDARKKPLPPQIAANYIITVSGLPMTGGARPGQKSGARSKFLPEQEGQPPAAGDQAQRRQAMLARIKESSKLTVKGKDPAAPNAVDMSPNQQSPVIVLGFSREALPLTAADKEVVFTTKVGPFEVKAKFALKDMLYQGKLEL
jgi:hypothetical protein